MHVIVLQLEPSQRNLGLNILPIESEARQCLCEHALKELALPRESHSGEIALSDSRRLRATLAAMPIRFAQAVATVAKHR